MLPSRRQQQPPLPLIGTPTRHRKDVSPPSPNSPSVASTSSSWCSITVIVQLIVLGGIITWFSLNLIFLRNSQNGVGETVDIINNGLENYEGRKLNNAVGTIVESSNHKDRALNPLSESLRKSRLGLEYINATSNRMHGVLGLNDAGEFHFKPASPPPSDQNMALALRVGGGFNLALSDSLPLDRDVTDSRNAECRALKYDTSTYPKASVVIVFYNEPFSTLFRSVHSVLNRTPPALLEEIVLVDDGSDLEWIRKGGTGLIEEYVRLLPKVKLVRNPVRQGIVGARMLGIRSCSAPIFVVLDSHIEVNEGWLEPVIERIKGDPKRVVMPQIDGLDPETFEPHSGGIGCTLGFLWKLIEHGMTPNEKSPKDRVNLGPTDPVTSPTMAGGLFAADKNYFLNDLGGYDEKFEYWGTENLEVSFRIWMCGGRLEGTPCSRVYHIFRKGGQGYSSPGDATTKNKMRLLTIWMDEFADLAWRVLGQPRVDFGSYEELRQWREKKQCKSFSWFLNEINPEAYVKEVPKDVPYLGMLKNLGSNKCLDTDGNDYPGHKVSMYQCHGQRSQTWMYFRDPQHIMPVTNDETCLGASGKGDTTDWCNDGGRWSFDEATGLLTFLDKNKCLAVGGNDLHLVDCDSEDGNQKWSFTKYNPPKIFTPPPPPGLRGGK